MNLSDLQYTFPRSIADFEQMIVLQKRNLPQNISEKESRSQGFVTVQHTVDILKEMNQLGHHSIAKAGGEVVGYALFMAKELENTFEVLLPMFEQFRKVFYRGKPLYDYRFFVMGQVCVAKNYRGQGVFRGLYDQLYRKNRGTFDLIVTEVATRNTRSVRAHEKIGFETIQIYQSGDGEEWAIIGWGLGERDGDI